MRSEDRQTHESAQPRRVEAVNFVIGAAKAHDALARLNAHPEVFLSPLKEPNYYSRADLDPARFSSVKANTKLDSPTTSP